MWDSRSPGGGEARRQLPSSRSLDVRLRRTAGALVLRVGGRGALSSPDGAAFCLLVSLLLSSGSEESDSRTTGRWAWGFDLFSSPSTGITGGDCL